MTKHYPHYDQHGDYLIGGHHVPKIYDCRYCGCSTFSEKTMKNHIDEEHWWLDHPERIILP